MIKDNYKYINACNLLKRMIEIPSCTFNEEKVADYLFDYLKQQSVAYDECSKENRHVDSDLAKERRVHRGFEVLRIANNVVAVPNNYNPKWQTLMLNAHIDTVQPAESYSNNPYEAIEKDGAIYGLGSNDDGGSVVALTETFLHFVNLNDGDAIYDGCCDKGEAGLNIVLVLSAEEERSGADGVSRVLAELPQHGIKVDFAIVGEPTGMRAAIAERGLLVLDGTAEGVSGHAARNEGVNALYKAIEDIDALRKFRFAKHSALMGDVKLTVTQINAGTVHNVIPDRCTFVVDIRPTEQYTNSEIVELLQKEVGSTLVARNLKNRSSATPEDHLLLKAVKECGIETFISPTTSDWMRLDGIPAIKIGPGDSARSHKADEYILKDEISHGIKTYIRIIETVCTQNSKYMDRQSRF